MKKAHVKISMLITAVAFVVSSCLDNNNYTPPDYDAILTSNLAAVDQAQLTIDKTIIDDSLQRVNWEVQPTSIMYDLKGGVRYTIQTLGTGAKPTLTSYIKAKYKAKLLANGPDDTPPAFDTNDNLQINLFSLILGWQTALPNLPQGTKATLYIPSGLAYGNVDVKDSDGDIVVPKNSNLIFEIELVTVSN
jgi:FKBP-type peptidyl-prolyl cis-trans isomerase